MGNALGDLRLQKRGDALAERSDALRRAAQLDATSDQARQQSNADVKAKSDKAIDDQQEARAAKSYKPGPQPRSASVRLKSRPRAPLPRRSRPTTWLPSTRILAKRPSAMNKPELGRTSKGRRGCQVKAQPR